MRGRPNQVILTFDIEGVPQGEDFFGNASLSCLRKTLDLLDCVGFKGLFFITASAAERIRKYPDLLERLSYHEIGYHSSSHSVRPRIIEYTDVASYEEALAISLERETSHINPRTGQIEASGGILTLRETFRRNDIVSFRAPFLGWSPPHLEALKELGIKFDFSSGITEHPVSFKGITFYPFPIPIDDCMEATLLRRAPKDTFPELVSSILLRRKVTVLLMHPSTLLVRDRRADRDEYKFAGNVKTKIVFCLLRLLLHRIRFLQKSSLLEVTSSLSQNWPPLNVGEIDVREIYTQSIESLSHLFGCNPRFVLSHFMRFFEKIPNYEKEPEGGLKE